MDLRETTRLLGTLNDWSLEGKSIMKEYTFKNFVESIEFVNKVKDVAEAYEHHPEIVISYNKVILTLTTHSAGGLTEKDFIVAKDIDGIV